MAEFSTLPYNDPCVRAAYHFIATGETLDSSWYRELGAISAIPDVDTFIQEHRVQHNTESITLEEAGPSGTFNDDASDNNIEVMDEDADLSENEEENIDSLKEEYKEVYSLFEAKLFSNLQKKDFIRCFKKFTAALKKMTKSNDETLKRRLFEISQNETKTKKGKYIPVQPTALARRNYKHRGRMAASYGRRVKDSAMKAQMVCDDTSDRVYFTLPKQKQRANKLAHSLQASVASNRPNAKKH